MSPEARARRLVSTYRARPDSSARTLLVTVFGDTILPRGGAERRIYHGHATTWGGRWTVVAVAADLVDPSTRADLVQRLRWLGFGSLGTGVLLSPVDHVDEVRSIVAELHAGTGVAVFRAERAHEELGLGDGQLAHACFDTRAVAALYQAFVRRFRPLAETGAEGLAELDDELAFLVRTLVVDAFRRVVLREPELPRPLWPYDWIGNRARELASTIHRAVSPGADRHVTNVAEHPGGRLPPPAAATRTRFTE